MAGNYPNVPSWRMAWDRDGTQAYFISRANVITQLTSGQCQALNDESDTSIANTGFPAAGGQLALIFPELRDLDAHFMSGALNGTQGSVQVSTNTTNGVDGTWTTLLAFGSKPWTQQVIPNYRSAIVAGTALGIKSVRFDVSSVGNAVSAIGSLHVYGEPIPGANPNRLALWHATLDSRLAPWADDWGDVPRSSSEDRTFRVKNLSSSLTANSVRVAQEILTDTSPSVVGQHTLSFGGGSFLPQVNVGNLAPGTISGVVTIRRNTPSNAVLGTWTHRVFAEANSWS